MKQIKYLLFALACTLCASCMDGDDGDWTDPATEETANTFGNPYITESNLITIAQLKSTYKSVIDNGGYTQVKNATQIKGVVTGNDIGGNIYNEIAIQDETGAFIICISQGGLYGYLPMGQEVLIELQGLYIGGYGKQGQVGTLYTSKSGSTYVSRMARALWQQHYKLLGKKSVTPIEVTDIKQLNLEADCGKLITLKGVTISEANGTNTYAPDDGSATVQANCVNRTFKGINKNNLVLRTSTYAKFANVIMPTGTVDVTGVATRYNNTWQILLRNENDVK